MKDDGKQPKNTKLDNLVERYKPIPMKRLYYPRNMNLSEDFVNAFHREYDRFIDEGQNPKNLIERFGKALKFHAGEVRKYKQLDEEQAALDTDKKNQDKKSRSDIKRKLKNLDHDVSDKKDGSVDDTDSDD